MANNKVKFLRGTADEYTSAVKDNDTIYFITDDKKLYIGDEEITGGSIIIDTTLSDTSENPVQNKIVKAELDKKANKEIYTDNGISLGRDPGTDLGFNSIAIGGYCKATGITSIAIGNEAVATGNKSTSIGNFTTASGDKSAAMGDGTVAEGWNSLAGGLESKTVGHNSIALGYGVETNKNCSAAFGEFNQSDSNTLFSIGDGDDFDARHNAFEITKTGGKLHDKDIATTDMIPETVGNYSKPENGIPKSDLSSDVQASLAKADTALQSHQSLADYVKTTDSRLTDARPANGGNAATVNGHAVGADVPANAKFTDTIYAAATQLADGLMSKEDKIKLDGLSGDDSASSYYIQSGTVTITSAMRDGTSITFPQPFKSVPLLALTAPFNMISGSNTPVAQILGYGNLSAEGFTLYPFGFSSTGEKYNANSMVGTARWFALGKI